MANAAAERQLFRKEPHARCASTDVGGPGRVSAYGSPLAQGPAPAGRIGGTAAVVAATNCEAVAQQARALRNVRVTAVETIAAGSFAAPGVGRQNGPGPAAGRQIGPGPAAAAPGGAGPGRNRARGRRVGLGNNGGRPNARYDELPAFCRIAVTLMPTPTSDIRAEVWLPITGWNGNFIGTSPNGMGGTIPYASMANALRDGYAVMGEDTGHRANEAKWMDDQERRIDFGHRAIHEATVLAKALDDGVLRRSADVLIHARVRRRLDGGARGVQNYPADYDGVVVGGFAANWTRQTFSQMWPFAATHRDAGELHPAREIPGHPSRGDECVRCCSTAYATACSKIHRCSWHPAAMACTGADSLDCLTAPQVEAVRKVYRGQSILGRAEASTPRSIAAASWSGSCCWSAAAWRRRSDDAVLPQVSCSRIRTGITGRGR